MSNEGVAGYLVWRKILGRLWAERRPIDMPFNNKNTPTVNQGVGVVAHHPLTKAEMMLSIKQLEAKYPAPKAK